MSLPAAVSTKRPGWVWMRSGGPGREEIGTGESGWGQGTWGVWMGAGELGETRWGWRDLGGLCVDRGTWERLDGDRGTWEGRAWVRSGAGAHTSGAWEAVESWPLSTCPQSPNTCFPPQRQPTTSQTLRCLCPSAHHRGAQLRKQ